MMQEEELEQLQAEKAAWREIAHEKQREVQQLQHEKQVLRDGLKEAIQAIERLQEYANNLEGQIGVLQERVKTLEGQQAKDSHNSNLPPPSDRFVRPPKSLKQKSGKKPGGQKGHRGHHLRQVEMPDAVLVHAVERCERCQQDLRSRRVTIAVRRQVIDLPAKRLWVAEHLVEERQCPTCFHPDVCGGSAQAALGQEDERTAPGYESAGRAGQNAGAKRPGAPGGSRVVASV